MATQKRKHQLTSTWLVALLSLCLITGCQTGQPLTDDSIKSSPITNAFNLDVKSLRSVSINWPDNVTQESLIMETLLAQLKLTEHRSLSIEKQKLSANQYQIEMLSHQVSSHTVTSIYHVATVQNESGLWQLKSVEQAIKCVDSYQSTCPLQTQKQMQE